MILPSPEQLGLALKKWRRDHGGSSQKKIAKESEEHSKNSFTHQQVGRWENATQTFTYKQLVEDILPAYQILDFDTFLDFCRGPSVEDVTFISADQFTPGHLSEGVDDFFVARPFLEKRQHRTRIDKVIFRPGKTNVTKWGCHNGHEFVLVVKGAVVCEFAVNKKDTPLTRTLTTDMAVVFTSSLFHRFGNASDTDDAVLVVAKPTNGRTADKD